jgi:23S rRNA (guanosine2251-2'-O)-methyltransferase
VARLETILGADALEQALKDGRRIVEILAESGSPGAASEAVASARAEGVPIRLVSKAKLFEESGGHEDADVLAYIKSEGYTGLDALVAYASASGPPVLIALDRVEDAEALGGVARVAEAAGAKGLVLAQSGLGITPAVSRAARGALEDVKVARVADLAKAWGRLQDQGLDIIGVDAGGTHQARASTKGFVLVLAPEGHRLSAAVAEACTQRLAFPWGERGASLPLAALCAWALWQASAAEKRATT